MIEWCGVGEVGVEGGRDRGGAGSGNNFFHHEDDFCRL